MMNHFNGLSPSEAERLALLMEEMGEAIQIIGKILRHGYESHHPDGGPSNRALLERELGDVEAAKQMMCERGDMDAEYILLCARTKKERVRPYLHHQLDVK